jgi:hypothetical protein
VGERGDPEHHENDCDDHGKVDLREFARGRKPREQFLRSLLHSRKC